MATLFVSPFGDDASPGTLDAPFRTIQKGVDALTAPGDVLFVWGGSYAENVRVVHKHGSVEAPILIRAYGRERVTIDGAEPPDIAGERSHFRVGGNDEWKLASEEDPEAHEEEYLSVRTFPVGNEALLLRHGAFMDREPYTRLITYARLEDLRAVNQTFGRLPLDDPLPPFPGLPVVHEDGTPVSFHQPDGTHVTEFKRPWVYMGPGLFFDEVGRIHVRLSHTVNNVQGIVDYDGGRDPRQLRLAISQRAPAPLVVEHCSLVRFDHLEVRFGGDRTIRIETSDDVVFDHVRVCAGSEGIRLGHDTTGVVFRHCEVLGGIPTWMFRSDIKDGYLAKNGDEVISDDLGHGTSQALLAGVADNVGTLVHNCEFVDGHDLYMFGHRTRFHRNWIHNLHDDGLVMETKGTSDLEVSQNVIMRCLEVMGFALTEDLGGERKVHHNLIDLRGPTAGIRPRPSGHLIADDEENKDGSVFRFGQIYKSNPPDGPLDLFHNTCLVANQALTAGIQHYRNSEGETRRAANNIYVDVTPSANRRPDYASAFLPLPDFHGPTDANCFFQLTDEGIPLLRHGPYEPGRHTADSFTSLDDYRNGIGEPPNTPPNTHFTDSQSVYPPGFEKHSIEGDPLFERIAPDGVPQFDDDLRLQALSPARQRGIDLGDIGINDPLASPSVIPDLGCYQLDTLGLDVGVDGRRQFPEHR